LGLWKKGVKSSFKPGGEGSQAQEEAHFLKASFKEESGPNLKGTFEKVKPKFWVSHRTLGLRFPQKLGLETQNERVI